MMDDPNITIKEYISLGEEKAQKHGNLFNWETAKYALPSRDQRYQYLGCEGLQYTKGDIADFEKRLQGKYAKGLLLLVEDLLLLVKVKAVDIKLRLLEQSAAVDENIKKMLRNMSYLSDLEAINGGYVAFGSNPKGGKITGKGKIRTDTECIVLSLNFKLLDENQMLLRVPRENNMYNVDLKNIVPLGDLTCLFAKETFDESNLWHKRLAHINFKTMNKLVKDLLLPIPFWAEAVNTACYIQNRVLVTKPYNKTPYELLLGRTPSIGFMRPFGYLVTILNTLDPLGKFDRKVDEGFLVGYSVSSKDFRVFNSRTRILQETLHINFLENKPNVTGCGPTWLFDIDTLTKSMNYYPVTTGNQPNLSAGVQELFDAEKEREGNVQQYVLFPSWSFGFKDPQNTDNDTTFEVKENEFKVRKPESKVHVSSSSSAKTKKHDDKTKREAKGKSHVELSTGVKKLIEEFKYFTDNSTNEVNAASTPVPAIGQVFANNTNTFNAVVPFNTDVSPTLGESSYVDPSQYPNDPNMPDLEDITYFDNKEDVGAEADFTNLEATITLSPMPITRVHRDHLVSQIIGDLSFAPLTRSMTRMVTDQGGLTQINNDDFHTCTKWVFRNKKDERGIVVKNKAQLVAQGHTQEEGIDYEEVFAPVARIESRLFLAYASFMGFMVYQMDVKSAFLYETIEEEVYVCQPTGFEAPDYPDKVYVDDIIFGSTNKDLCKAFEKLMKDKFQMSSMGELTFFLGLQVKQKAWCNTPKMGRSEIRIFGACYFSDQ
uniref:Putative ribonuclease H-like domain-containing protein n=1 Tax=Tanacetum cinerariifolium TaxID=118510 RepID=A0A6L2LZQ9_TANCI|nr:putative ribonuclease H-like domain-containing protein [Tanacetum cinerariifolium]